jgi:formiminotetrahydrofolate cyclodeaminase
MEASGASASLPFGDLLESLASRTPAPGGGCATAWSAAIAAGLLEMAARFAGAHDEVTRAAALRAELVAQGEVERSSYAPVLEALRLPSDDPSRAALVADALSEASEGPLAIVRAASEVAELAVGVAVRAKRDLSGDAIAGALLAEAACQAAARLVELNLAGRPDDRRLAELATLKLRAAGARDRALGAG